MLHIFETELYNSFMALLLGLLNNSCSYMYMYRYHSVNRLVMNGTNLSLLKVKIDIKFLHNKCIIPPCD